MRMRALQFGVAALACAGLSVAGAQAANGPPLPKAPGGKTVSVVAVGVKTPTSFAYGAGTLFEGDGGFQTNGPPNGGVNVLKNGTATAVSTSLRFVAGLAWHDDALYVSGGSLAGKGVTWTLQKWTGFNGTTFASQKVIYTAPKKFQGFNGIAFGPNGRLYVGVDTGLLNNNDHGPATTSPYLYDILSLRADGSGLKVFASGIRQPWQLAFAPGSSAPLVSDLGQDKGAKNPPDFVLKVRSGDDYGFPTCNHVVAKKCKGFAKPLRSFKPHTDIMGMVIIGKTLYMTSFLSAGARGPGGEVVSMPLSGGPLKPVLTGFVAPTVGLGSDGKRLFVGQVGKNAAKPGIVYTVTP
ncbi:MAG: hypothetical protein JOZ07_07005 [Solirubrobacterales bacterium]|nr:hypothetical protein [Solirubrobacterales bacterium]